ncbi:MAG: hypothetical protein ACFFDH_09590 [Promethearchaeota archaeon]
MVTKPIRIVELNTIELRKRKDRIFVERLKNVKMDDIEIIIP